MAVTATAAMSPVPAGAQAPETTTEDELAPQISQLRHPSERDIYDVDTSNWDFTEPGMNKNSIDNHYYEDKLPTDDPKPEIIEGQMRSDRMDIPGEVDKKEADEAEIQEAHELGIYPAGEQPRVNTLAADNCRSYWPTTHQVCGAIRFCNKTGSSSRKDSQQPN
ncbi:hypothetical protein WG915_05480 [Corynebacterium sp. H128]|uniref:hypothetical protein n=1 Tax=Corynebacterium sp. H128 TaxID=3133427 RepID=UPI0030B5FDF7